MKLSQLSSFKIKFFALFTLYLISFNESVYSIQENHKSPNEDSVNLIILIDSVRKIRYNNYIYAHEIAMKGLKKYKHNINLIDRIRLLQLTAEIEYNYLRQFDKSIVHLNEMRRLSDSINYKDGKPWVKLNMANLYYVQKDFKKSMKLFREAKADALISKDSVIVINALNGIADIFSLQEKNDSALKILHKCLFYAKQNNLFDSQIYINEDLALIHKRTNNIDSSIYYYKKLLEVSNRLNNLKNIVNAEIHLTYLEHLKNNALNPVPKLKTLQEKCKKNGFYILYYEAGYILSEILESYKLYNQALSVYKEAKLIEDSITANEKIRRVAELESSYYINEKEFENKELERINEINTLKLKNRQYFIFFVLFILIQAIILLYIIYRKYRTIKHQEEMIFDQEKQILQKEKEAMAQKIQSQEREMTGKVMKIYQHNQLIQKVIEDIKNIKEILEYEKTDKKIVHEKLQSMVNQLKLSSNEQMWTEFERSFIETNPGYLEKLSDKYPDLTPNEIKLCVFLFLNLRTKDISIITQQSVKSINVARTRLRKKLKLDNTNTNLSVFLRHI